MERYETFEPIGSNHYAAVFSGYDHNSGRDVAIMELNEDFFLRTDRAEAVWADVLATVGVRDRNLVPVFDVDRERRLIVMERMQGNLQASIDREPISPALGRSVLRQILEALRALHAAGRLHGDVKPAQMLYNQEGRVLLGFSPGLVLGGVVPHRRTDHKHQAPELLKTDAFGPLGPQTDLYCLGFSLLELLKGPDFDGLFRGAGADPQIAWARWHGDPARTLPTAAEAVPGLPPDLAKVLDRMLQKRVEDRYPSAQAVLDQLNEAPLERVAVTATSHAGSSPSAAAKPRSGSSVQIDPPASAGDAARAGNRGIVAASGANQKTPGAKQSISPGKSPASHRPRGAQPWSREWVNQRLEDPRVMAAVVAMILLPVVLFGAFKLTRGGGKTEIAANGSVSDEEAEKVANTGSTGEDEVSENGSTGNREGEVSAGEEEFPLSSQTTFMIQGPTDSTAQLRLDGQPVELSPDNIAQVNWPEQFASLGKNDEVLIEASAEGFETLVERALLSQLIARSRVPLPLRPSRPSPDELAQEAYLQGRELLRREDWEGAEEAFTVALSVEPRMGEALRDRAIARAGARKLNEAVEDFYASAELLPDDLDLLLGWGEALLELQQWDAAEEQLTAALSLAPDSVRGLAGRALAHYRQNHLEPAFRDAAELLRQDPASEQASFALNLQGTIYRRQNQIDEAMAVFSEAIEQYPDRPEAFYNRGRLQYAKVANARGEQTASALFNGAIADLREADRLRPEHPPTLNALGIALADQGRHDAAIGIFTLAIAADPRYALAYYNRAQSFRAVGRHEEAADDLQRSSEMRNADQQ